MKVISVSQASGMDRSAVKEYSIPEIILMENGAAACCSVIKSSFTIERNNFIILCGTGNNGGDGLALARFLYSEGGAPLVFLNGLPDKLKDSALQNYNILKNLPIEIISQFNIDLLKKEIIETDIIIDALLGTGLNREIQGNLKTIIETINSSEKSIVSIDIPSGINGDTGQIMGVAVRAQITITFGSLKTGNLLYPGFVNCGKIYLSRISLPPEIYDSNTIINEINICNPLPKRDEDGYKRSFGDILTISGASTYYGAPRFSAAAVLKSGAGFSRLAAPVSMIPVLAANLPEAVFIPMRETEEGTIDCSNLSILLQIGEKADGAIIGPGLSLNNETAQLIRDFVSSYKKFLLIDGDGLSAIAGKAELISHRKIPAVLTPHKGEFSRLSGYSISKIEKDPVSVLQECSDLYNSVIVLKGAHSLIGFPDGRVLINMTGNSGLGTAGCGDILTGIIAAFYGLGMDLYNAVKSGVFVHGACGDDAAEKLGKDGITATDILNTLPYTVKKYREEYKQFINHYKNIIKII